MLVDLQQLLRFLVVLGLAVRVKVLLVGLCRLVDQKIHTRCHDVE